MLYGNVDQECTGIVTSCWASVDVIKYVIEKGANLIISHEALFLESWRSSRMARRIKK